MLGLFKEEEHTVSQEEGLKIARQLLTSSLNKGHIPDWGTLQSELPDIDNLEVIQDFFFTLTDSHFLNEILRSEATEFFFHSPDSCQYIRPDGEKINFSLPLTNDDWQLWLEILSIRFAQNWNVENPFASFYGEIGGRKFRLTLIHSSTSPMGQSKLVLRSLAQVPHPLESFGETGSLRKLIREKKNILIAGSTGSGKTSLLSSLIKEIPSQEHIAILEDTFEISYSHPYETRFLSGESPQTSLKSYLTYCLRLSPDRIVLGEMRSHEVIPFLMAMNTGHRGLMGTVHASSASDALYRVALLFSLYSGELAFEKVMELLCRNLEYVVFMENKKVTEVIKILGSEKGVPFFEKVGHSQKEVTDREFNLF